MFAIFICVIIMNRHICIGTFCFTFWAISANNIDKSLSLDMINWISMLSFYFCLAYEGNQRKDVQNYFLRVHRLENVWM